MPWTMVPDLRLVKILSVQGLEVFIPVFSSTVTDSFVHFMRNLFCPSVRLFWSQPSISCSASGMLHCANVGLPDELHIRDVVRSRAISEIFVVDTVVISGLIWRDTGCRRRLLVWF